MSDEADAGIRVRVVWRCPERDCDWRVNSASGPGRCPEDDRQVRKLGARHYAVRHPDTPLSPARLAAGWPPKLCVVPDCTTPAKLVFHAAERGRLAGRDWQPGDAIDLCPRHGNDVYDAQGTYGVDELAEWLRPDARRGAEARA